MFCTCFVRARIKPPAQYSGAMPCFTSSLPELAILAKYRGKPVKDSTTGQGRLRRLVLPSLTLSPDQAAVLRMRRLYLQFPGPRSFIRYRQELPPHPTLVPGTLEVSFLPSDQRERGNLVQPSYFDLLLKSGLKCCCQFNCRS